jgi:hypothetical protein
MNKSNPYQDFMSGSYYHMIGEREYWKSTATIHPVPEIETSGCTTACVNVGAIAFCFSFRLRLSLRIFLSLGQN